MEDSSFWNKLAKYLSGNGSKSEKDIFSPAKLNGNAQTMRDAATIFGKSSQEIEESFEKLSEKTKK